MALKGAYTRNLTPLIYLGSVGHGGWITTCPQPLAIIGCMPLSKPTCLFKRRISLQDVAETHDPQAPILLGNGEEVIEPKVLALVATCPAQGLGGQQPQKGLGRGRHRPQTLGADASDLVVHQHDAFHERGGQRGLCSAASALVLCASRRTFLCQSP